jgi:hypothetical protein
MQVNKKLMLDHCQVNIAKQMPMMVSEDFYYLDTDWAASVKCRCCPSNNALFADRASGRRLQFNLKTGHMYSMQDWLRCQVLYRLHWLLCMAMKMRMLFSSI